ncbi:unnamed protein product [Dicrocoelium dendriticum]|nr:unnamed protein product [Dicrocoelium dendriticum]
MPPHPGSGPLGRSIPPRSSRPARAARTPNAGRRVSPLSSHGTPRAMANTTTLSLYRASDQGHRHPLAPTSLRRADKVGARSITGSGDEQGTHPSAIPIPI